MTNKNTMTKLSYIAENIFWLIAAFIGYDALCFINIPGLTTSDSKTILLLIISVCLFWGIFFTFRHRRNQVSVAVNILVPFELYALISLGNLFTTRAVIVLAVTAVLCVGFTYLVMHKPRRKDADIKVVRTSRIKHSLLGIRTIAAVCVLAFVIPVAVNTVMGNGLYKSDIESSPYIEEPSEWTVKKQFDTVKLIKEENWEKLNVQEKMDVLAVIKNIEMRYLGVNHEVYLKTKELDSGTLANYSEAEYTITIDVDHLCSSPPQNVLQSLCHECYHAYQFQQVHLFETIPEEYKNMLMFANAKDYEYEFANYKDADSDGYSAYAAQTVEQNADKYGDKAIKDYYTMIEQYESEGL